MHSVQAISKDERSPDVSVYRMTVQDARKWMKQAARDNGFSAYCLRNSADEIEIHDADGDFLATLTAETWKTIPDVEEVIETSRDAMVSEAREILRNPNLTLIVSAEYHAGASAADHSNFVIICHRMILEACAADLDKIFVVESRLWQCRVIGIYADIGALSPAMQDVYLERYKWLNASWPLNSGHHMSMLAVRLASARQSYVTGLLLDCGYAAGMFEEMILTLQSRWMLAPYGAKYRFAHHLAETLRDGLLFEIGEPEVFDLARLDDHGAAAVRDFEKFMP